MRRLCGAPIGAIGALAALVIIIVTSGCGAPDHSAYADSAPIAPAVEPPPQPTTTTTKPKPKPAVEAATVVRSAERGVPIQSPTTPPPPRPQADDCVWVAEELAARNVSQQWIDWSITIAKRESRCCPNVMGGDRTNSECVVTHVAEWDHRSDTGLWQLNRANYRGAGTLLCDAGIACDQETLLANVHLQFDGYLLLLARCGKLPWTPPDWGCTPADIFN